MRKISACASRVGRILQTKASRVMAVSTAVIGATFAEGVTLPDTGVDIADYVAVMVTTLGAILGVVIAAVIAFLCVRKGLGLLRKVKP